MKNIILGLGALAFLGACSSPETTIENKLVLEKKSTITPPFENIKLPFKSYTIDPLLGGKIQLENGTKISIPANAFVDKQGNPIEKPVDICYREFHSIADVMASGIPMGYDSAGVHADFATAGMFEIRALDENKGELSLAQNKNIDVKMASFTNGGGYNIYHFKEKNTQKEEVSQAGMFGTLLQIAPIQTTREVSLETAVIQGEWVYKAAPEVAENEEKKALADSLLTTENVIQPTEPLAFKKDAYTFDLNFDVKEFPELEGFENIFWQYVGTDEKSNPATSELMNQVKEWNDIKLKASETKQGVYTMTLTSGSKVFVTEIAPMLKGKSLEKAQAKFAKKMAKFEKKYNKRKSQERRAELMASFVRSVQVTTMGVWNCDKPISQKTFNLMVEKNKEKTKQVQEAMLYCNASFLVEGKKIPLKFIYSINSITLGNIYQGVNNDYTTTVRFEKEELGDFYLSPLAKNRIVVLLENGKSAYVDTKTISALDFDKIKTEGEVVFDAKIVPEKHTASLQDVQKFIDTL